MIVRVLPVQFVAAGRAAQWGATTGPPSTAVHPATAVVTARRGARQLERGAVTLAAAAECSVRMWREKIRVVP